MIVLPEKRKNQRKVSCKTSKQNKAKPQMPQNKSKQRKLKQLEEEKRRKVLESESINFLKKYKIADEAYSLLQSSRTIGQVETAREKRIRAAQFSKTGLEVPEDIKPFKKLKSNDNDKVMMEFYLDNSELEHSYGHYGHSCSEETEPLGAPAFMSNDNRRDATNCKDYEGDAINDLETTDPTILDRAVQVPVVVHVLRPNVIEEKRRDLPIVMMEQEIMEAINENSTLIVCGETGCGKTTQVPQFLYEAGYGSNCCSNKKGLIGITQPRRVAVLATAKRVSFELGVHLGKEVGFQVRHDKMIGKCCSIKFMTDGILLREVQSDFLLKQYSVIILDEAHERSLNTDILIGMLSRVVRLRHKLHVEQQEKILLGVKIKPESLITPLRLILMSATLCVKDFVSNKKLFHEPPSVIEVPTRQFPVTIHFSKRTDIMDYIGQAYKKVLLIHRRLPPGGILVFVTGQREVEYLCKKLRQASQKIYKSDQMENMNNETAVTSMDEVKDIEEAFEISKSSQQIDHFFSQKEEDDDPSYPNSATEDDSPDVDDEDDSDEEISGTVEKTNQVLDFLTESKSLSALKGCFEAIGGDRGYVVTPVTNTKDVCSEKFPDIAGPMRVMPLYAMLPASKQLRVFEDVREGERLVVVATNVAETSLTIPGIKYVVDTGREKVKDYDCRSGMAMYKVQWISKASAAQRAGRAGRTGPGHCYRLYSAAAFHNLFSEFSSAEIQKVPMDSVMLLMKYMGINKVENFPFPTPPVTSALLEAERTLKALEALDGGGRLTHIGRVMAQYPMSPHHSRMLLSFIQVMKNQQSYPRANLVFGFAIAAVAALSFQMPYMLFERNLRTSDDLDEKSENNSKKIVDREERKAQQHLKTMFREVHKRFCNPSSDVLTVSYALQMFELAENRAEFCETNLLHFKIMDEMSKLRKQILQLAFFLGSFDDDFSWSYGSVEDVETIWRKPSNKHPLLMVEEEILGQAICAGWANRVARRITASEMVSDKDHKVRAVKYMSCAFKETVYIHHSSSVARTAPEFVVYTELLSSKRPYIHGVTSVKPEWLVKYAPSLCNFSTSLSNVKPYYEPSADQVFCWVKPTFGPHDWELPLHSVPINDAKQRISVFACALLGGNVLPCLKQVQKFLVAPPSSILRPEASGQRRVGDLLYRLKFGAVLIDSRATLHDVWRNSPQLLHSEVQCWFQRSFSSQFEELWEQMHYEASLGAQDLFPNG